MGMMTMVDDRALLLKVILDRIDKSDADTKVAIKDLKEDNRAAIRALADQHESDKAEAIQRGKEGTERAEERHTETQIELKSLNEKGTLTGGRVSVLEKRMDEDVQPMVIWHRDEGGKLGGRVSMLEQAELNRTTAESQAAIARASEKGERRGRTSTIAIFVSVATTILAAIWAVAATFGKDLLDRFFNTH